MLPTSPQWPHAYARRHLASHAAAAGKLDDEVLNLRTLPYLDEARLSAVLRLTEATPFSPLWLLLGAWRSIRHRWSWDDPDANAAALDVALRAADPMAPLPPRRPASGLAWRPRLVEWQSGGTIVAGDERSELHLAIGTVRGTPVLVTGNPWRLRIWDPATGQPIGEELTTPRPMRAVALAEGPGIVVTACEGGQVVLWDAVTHLPAGTIEEADPHPLALAVGEVDNRWLVAVGGVSGVVQVSWLDSGELIQEVGDIGSLRALALARRPDGRLRLAIGAVEQVSSRISVRDALSGATPDVVIRMPGEITDVALGRTGSGLAVAAGSREGAVGLWSAETSRPLAQGMSHDGPVRSLALTTIGGMPLLATGGADRTVKLWRVDGSTAGPPLPHPAPVTTVAFGDVEGRTVVLTGCLDGNTRLWDPLRSSAARVAVEGWFPSVTLDSDVVVAGSEEGQVRLWDVASGVPLPPLPLEPGPSYPGGPVEVWLGGGRTRRLVTRSGNDLAVWDLADPSSPTLLAEATFPRARASAVHVVPASERALFASVEGPDRVAVTDLLTRDLVFTTRITGAASMLFLDAPGRPLLAVGAGDRLHLLDAESGERIRTPLRARLPRHAALGRLDGAEILATLDSDGLRLFDLGTGAPTIPTVEMSRTASGVAWGRVGDRDLVLTAHFATVRVWNPRTGRKITELPFGTRIGALGVHGAGGGRLLVAVSGPGLVLTELREVP